MSIVQTRCGRFKVIDNDTIVSRSLMLYGEWAQREIDLMACFIRPGFVVADVGAFIGTHSRAFSANVGPEGRVLAFEPRPDSAAVLSENADMAPTRNIRVVNKALGDCEKTVPLSVLHDDKSANYAGLSLEMSIDTKYPADNTSNFEEIAVTTLDSFDLDRLDFMKVDVEGMELDVLKGGIRTIERCKPIVFTECNSLGGGLPIMQWCREREYRVYGVLTPAYNPTNFAGCLQDVFNGSMEVGLLLFPCESLPNCMKKILEENLPELNTPDDLALLLLQKPQYPHAIFASSKASKSLSLNYPSMLADELKQFVVERDRQIAQRDRQIAEQDRQMAFCKADLLAITQSRSWRLTVPLRLLDPVAAFRRILNLPCVGKEQVFQRFLTRIRKVKP